MPIRPRVVHSDAVFRIAYWQNVMITDVVGDIDVDRMRRMGRGYRELLTEHPNGIVSVAFLRAGVPVASADSRTEAARFMKELGDSILRVAIVMEERGILAQTLQTVIRGINVITRSSKLVVHDTVEDAVASIMPLVVPPPSAGDPTVELREAITAARSDYSPPQSKPAARKATR